jgi:hypothetical protein
MFEFKIGAKSTNLNLWSTCRSKQVVAWIAESLSATQAAHWEISFQSGTTSFGVETKKKRLIDFMSPTTSLNSQVASVLHLVKQHV